MKLDTDIGKNPHTALEYAIMHLIHKFGEEEAIKELKNSLYLLENTEHYQDSIQMLIIKD